MAGNKVLDAAHKIVALGLVGATTFGIYDVTRGFNIMYTRNVERRKQWAEQAALEAQNATGNTEQKL